MDLFSASGVIAALAYYVPFAFWALLCGGALFAFSRAVTNPPRDDLETRGVFSTLSERLGSAAAASRIRRAIVAGLALGVPITFGACRIVLDAKKPLEGSMFVLIAVGWFLFSVSSVATIALVANPRR
ncbi:MAG: hypothetical protein ACPGVZ_04705 [Myxococcota bacterium]